MSAALAVDWARCDGSGLCAALLPHAIGRDEWGFPIVLGSAVDADDEADVRRVIAACPALALHLEPR
jgi:ferredoxin